MYQDLENSARDSLTRTGRRVTKPVERPTSAQATVSHRQDHGHIQVSGLNTRQIDEVIN